MGRELVWNDRSRAHHLTYLVWSCIIIVDQVLAERPFCHGVYSSIRFSASSLHQVVIGTPQISLDFGLCNEKHLHKHTTQRFRNIELLHTLYTLLQAGNCQFIVVLPKFGHGRLRSGFDGFSKCGKPDWADWFLTAQTISDHSQNGIQCLEVFYCCIIEWIHAKFSVCIE